MMNIQVLPKKNPDQEIQMASDRCEVSHTALKNDFHSTRYPNRTSKVTSQGKAFATIKALAIKSDHLSLVPGTHVMRGETPTHVYTHTHKINTRNVLRNLPT